MKIVILGSGNVATVYAKKLSEAGHIISRIYSQNIENAADLADLVGAEPVNTVKNIVQDADIMIISISDHAVEEIIESLGKIDVPVFHTAGSISIDVLKNLTSGYGVIYPLQSLRKMMTSIPEIPVFIDGNNENAKNIAKTIASAIGNMVYEADDEKRKKLHLAAVFSSNFTNYLYCISKKYATDSGIPFESLLPLIEQTAIRLRDYPPETMQTGPAVRGDFNIIEQHLQMLHDYPTWKEIYEDLSMKIFKEFNSAE